MNLEEVQIKDRRQQKPELQLKVLIGQLVTIKHPRAYSQSHLET